MFVLTEEEWNSLRSQIVTLEEVRRGTHRKYLPMAFTEQGVAMLSGLLRSDRAVEANIAIMRAFVRMREILSTNDRLARKLEELENKLMRTTIKFRTLSMPLAVSWKHPKRVPARAAWARSPS